MTQPVANDLMQVINQKLASLTNKTGSLQTTSQENQRAISVTTQALAQTRARIEGVKSKVESLMKNVETIKNSKKQLEEFVNTKIVGKLTELDNSFTDIMKGIDIEPLVKELEPIQAELLAIESLIQTANLPDVPSSGVTSSAGPSGGSKRKSKYKPKQGKHNRTRKGGYIIPKRKQHSSRRKGHSSRRRT